MGSQKNARRKASARAASVVVHSLETRLLFANLGNAPPPTLPSDTATVGTDISSETSVARNNDGAGNPLPPDWFTPLFRLNVTSTETIQFQFTTDNGGGQISSSFQELTRTTLFKDSNANGKLDNGPGTNSPDAQIFSQTVHGLDAEGGDSLGTTSFTQNATLTPGTYLMMVDPVITPNPSLTGLVINDGNVDYTITLNLAEGPYPGPGPTAVPGTVQAENYDTGGEGVAWHDTTSGNQLGAYRQDDPDIFSGGGSSGDAIGNFGTGEWMQYTVNVASSANYTFDLRFATGSTDASFGVLVDGADKTGKVVTGSSGGSGTWADKTVTIPLTAGTHVLRLTNNSAASGKFINVDYFKLTSQTVTAGSISGTVFNDANGNAAKDTGEAGVSGRTVYIDANNNSVKDSTEVSATTDSSGNYKFSGLNAGTYKVREVVPSGSSQTFPTGNFGQTVTLSAGQNATGENFGVKTTTASGASITGTVFNDTNGNGILDTGDAGLSGRTVYVDANNNSKLDSGEKSATTNSSGVYTFTGLAAGSYKVRQVIPGGWAQTSPANGFGFTLSLSSSQNSTGDNFGTRATGTASIAGNVFNDANGNGLKDSGEANLSGWTVYIDLNNNGSLDSNELKTTTDSSGNYKFANLPAGTYKVRAVRPSGWSQTSPSSNFGQSVTLTSGQSATGKNFGERHS